MSAGVRSKQARKPKRASNGKSKPAAASAEAAIDDAQEAVTGEHEAVSPADDEGVHAEAEAPEHDERAEADQGEDEGAEHAASDGGEDERGDEDAIEPDPGESVAAADLDRARQKAVLESLIFVSERPVTPLQLARAMKVKAAVVRELLAELTQDFQGRGIELIEVASGYQFRSAPACAPFVREFVAQKPVRLTRAQLETLALIAYRQPITRPEIDDVRGVDSGSAIRVLLERNLVKMLGRKDEAGRPLLYGTTSHFLEFFGMRSLKDLPTLREFTELSEENRALFKKKTGESVEDAEAELLAAEAAARSSEESAEHVSDEDLAELAAEAATDYPPAGREDEEEQEQAREGARRDDLAEAEDTAGAGDEREREIEGAGVRGEGEGEDDGEGAGEGEGEEGEGGEGERAAYEGERDDSDDEDEEDEDDDGDDGDSDDEDEDDEDDDDSDDEDDDDSDDEDDEDEDDEDDDDD